MFGTWHEWLSQPLATWRLFQDERRAEQLSMLRARYQVFRALLDDNHRAVELLTELGIALRSSNFWSGAMAGGLQEVLEVTADLVEKLEHLTSGRSEGLTRRQERLAREIRAEFARLPSHEHLPACLPLAQIAPTMLRAVGGKAANLARLQRYAIFAVPSGFVVPVSVCRLFLEQKDLYLRLVTKLNGAEKDHDGLPHRLVVEAVKQQIMATPLPTELTHALTEAAAPLFAAGRGLAVRSSAVGEDTLSHSFAGQYVSVLNVVTEAQLEEAFKTVVASAFNLRNISYRKNAGLSPYEFDLAVLCLEMVEVRAAGILFTVDPNYSTDGRMLISAVHGLGELAVGGSEAADVYLPPRDGSGPGESRVAVKSRRLMSMVGGGVQEETLDQNTANAPVLREEEIMTLVHLGREAEDRLGGPQDIEWAVDLEGRVVILQARPLKIAAHTGRRVNLGPGRISLLTNGLTASPGRGVGLVRIVRSREDLENLNDPPYVLVMHQSLVEAVAALREVEALLVDLGNPADHLSCVAREYGIPMLTGLVRATEVLNGVEAILVDTDRGEVYTAIGEELVRHRQLHLARKEKWHDHEARPTEPILAAIYDRLIPLNLTDAYGPTFTIAECQSIHDLVRYAHEKAVLAMFEAGDEAVENASGVILNLESEIPFHVSLIDLGGGIMGGSGRWVKPKRVLSRPFTALWEGIITEGLNWGTVAGGVAVGSVVSRFITDHRSARPIGLPNYALVTRDFLNLNARMDFHFTMVDAICGIDPQANYIKFRFKGGGTGAEQRNRRVRCLAEILGEAGFFCDQRDDLLTASIQGGSSEIMEEKLRVVGRILGFSRLLDAAMRTDEMISKVAQAFMAGDYILAGLNLDTSKDQAQRS
ncbi:MAG: pyruvate, phosphate dikinase [Proteobacteria bacterium]|nr:pyruvate, phosphate dikinase [Pseudomonadota bacterium]MBU1686906.1 pyruvate, phosphate dikinase [Pseudomonadota bacterium]